MTDMSRPPVRATTGCAFCAQFNRPCDCDAYDEADTGLPSTEDRLAACKRAVAIIDALPKRGPSPAEVEAARMRADDAMRSLIAPLLSDDERKRLASHKAYNRSFGK